MDDGDQRTEELRQLRSDLAVFARRLDAFEARRKLSSLAENFQRKSFRSK